jgi:RimJ/RimL family protein N-acetyltransferase
MPLRRQGEERATAVSDPVIHNRILSAYKAGADTDPRGHAVDITWKARNLGLLVPALHALDADDLDRIASWRNTNRGRFFSEQRVSAASTAKWLAAAATLPDRLVFLITTEHRGIVGHIGLRDVDEARGTAEMDAWLGVGDERVPGVMLVGFANLIRWSFEHLSLQYLIGRVFADNVSVVRAHEEMLGSRLERQVGYVRRVEKTGAVWVEGEGPSPRSVRYYRLDRTAFQAATESWL